MTIPLYQIDAFTNRVFSGNPAGVCPLTEWLSERLMQNIAMENNLAETAFLVNKGNAFEIRWFTPSIEVDLCGHATLASAHALFHHEGHSGNEVTFLSPRSGMLKVYRNGDVLTLDFPADRLEPLELSPEILAAFPYRPVEAWKGKTDFMFVFPNEGMIQTMRPVFAAIANFKCRGVIVTAKGDTCDFVSRFFAPQSGIDEDPVTGSAHTTLTPYWSAKLGKKELSAVQLSQRTGTLKCVDKGDRIHISGNAKTYLVGKVEI